MARSHTNHDKLRIGVVQVEKCELPKDFRGPPIADRVLVRNFIEEGKESGGNGKQGLARHWRSKANILVPALDSDMMHEAHDNALFMFIIQHSPRHRSAIPFHHLRLLSTRPPRPPSARHLLPPSGTNSSLVARCFRVLRHSET
jgi:hypothetical protein